MIDRRRQGSPLKKRIPKEVAIKAIIDNKGIIYAAARALGCGRTALGEWIKKDPDLEAAYLEGCETVVDAAETVILNKLNSPDPKISLNAAIFLLETKGAHRGYARQQKLELSPWEKQNISFQKHSAEKNWKLTLGDGKNRLFIGLLQMRL